MKKTISVLLAILLVMSIALVPVFAQDGGTNPSATGDDYELIITTGSSEYAPIQDNLTAAETIAYTPEAGYTQVVLFDASRVKVNSDRNDYNNYSHDAFTFTYDVNLDGKDWYVMHLADNEVWNKLSSCSYSGGTLTIPAPSLSAFAIYAKDSSASGGEGTSPATGDNSVYFIFMAVVFAALAVVFVKKAVKNN